MANPTDVILPDTKSRETARFVFFAGDHITPSEKYANPTRFLGGVEADMYLTLAKTGRELYARHDLYNTGGVIYRCAITQLKTFYLPVNQNMIAPADREKYLEGYVEPNGRFNPKTGAYESVAVRGTYGRENGQNGDRRFSPFYPGDEIEAITRASSGLRPGGVVEIGALRGKTWEDQITAQIHFFPNWDRLQTEMDTFPKTLRELRANIVAKIAGATPELASIGRDMLRSCDEFKMWGLRYLKAWRQIVKWADTQIDSPIPGYNELCEMLFEMLEVNREDTLGQTRTDGGEVQQLAQLLLAGLKGQAAPADPMAGLDLAEGTPGVMVGDEPILRGTDGDGIPDYRDATPETFTPADPPKADEAVIKVGDKIPVDGKQALVTWKGPGGKMKVSFEDGTTKIVEKSEVTVGN